MRVKLPKDDPTMWTGVPLKGHICCMRFGDEKHYWTVENLIQLSSEFPVHSVSIDSLLESVRRGRWFQPNQTPTIGDVLDHVERAMNADLQCPIILSEEDRVMDGSHRVVACKIRGEETIPAVKFTKNPQPEFIEKIDTEAVQR